MAHDRKDMTRLITRQKRQLCQANFAIGCGGMGILHDLWLKKPTFFLKKSLVVKLSMKKATLYFMHNLTFRSYF